MTDKNVEITKVTFQPTGEWKEFVPMRSLSIECETELVEEPQLDTLEAKEFQIILVPNGYDVSKRFWTLEGFSSDGSNTITASIRVMRPGKSCKFIKIAGRKHKASEVRWTYYSYDGSTTMRKRKES